VNTTEIVSLVSSVGFPIVVAWYFMTKLNRAMEENTRALQSLQNALAKLCDKIEQK
jgi:hypothetical protein